MLDCQEPGCWSSYLSGMWIGLLEHSSGRCFGPPGPATVFGPREVGGPRHTSTTSAPPVLKSNTHIRHIESRSEWVRLFSQSVWVQGRLQDANRFFIALAHGSFSPASASADCTAQLMRAHLTRGNADRAARIFQSLPHLPARPPLSTSVISAATEALCLGNRCTTTCILLHQSLRAVFRQ